MSDEENGPKEETELGEDLTIGGLSTFRGSLPENLDSEMYGQLMEKFFGTRIDDLPVAIMDCPEDIAVLSAEELTEEWEIGMETLKRVLSSRPFMIEHASAGRMGTYEQLAKLWFGRKFELQRDALFRRSEINKFKDNYGEELAGIIRFKDSPAPKAKKSKPNHRQYEIPDRAKRKWKAIAVWAVLHHQDPNRSLKNIWESDEMFEIVHKPNAVTDRNAVTKDTSLRDWLAEERLRPRESRRGRPGKGKIRE